MHARVVVYKFKPGTADSAAKKAQASLLPVFQKSAGYESYEVIRTGKDTVISVSRWDTEVQAQAAATVGAAWAKENMASDVVSVDTQVGEVAFSHRRA